jgi:hypothetical protein
MERTHDPSGAALDTFGPLDREQELSRGRPKRVDCRGSRCAWNDLKTFSTQSVEPAPSPGRRILSNVIPANGLPAPNPIDLKKRNATPLRGVFCVRVNCCDVA